ncbi:MAG: hypothetical protein OK454_01670 [Thaumarchaeota archaeon]|nr:hypothetical protein [Nitrososphaerota archaeon]
MSTDTHLEDGMHDRRSPARIGTGARRPSLTQLGMTFDRSSSDGYSPPTSPGRPR